LGGQLFAIRSSTCTKTWDSQETQSCSLVKAGKALEINAVAADMQQSVSFPISMSGFGSALARTTTLSAD